MAISRAQLVSELEPGLNALFGLEYKKSIKTTRTNTPKSTQPRLQTARLKKR